MSGPKLTIVIPAYNESANLKNGVLDEVYDYLKAQKYSYEVLIVDDASKDDTPELVEKIIKTKKGFSLIKNEHGGKAITVMTGMLEAKGEIVLFTDMDQATPLSEIEKFWPEFEKGNDIVFGSRQGRAGAPLIRNIATWGFVTLRKIILGLPFRDTQCGFKAFKNKVSREIFSGMLERWKNNTASGAALNASFDVEMLFLAKKKGFKIKEVTVNWHYVGSERFHLIRDAIETTEDMLRIRFNDLLGKYN